MIHTCRWLLPIDRPAIEHGWIETVDGRIRQIGRGVPPGPAVDLADTAILPGLVNAHTHLELSWMAGQVAPAAAMTDWLRNLLRLRRGKTSVEPGFERDAAREAARQMAHTGTVLAGDVSNTLSSPSILKETGLGGVVFHEVLGFNAADPVLLVREAIARMAAAEASLDSAPQPVRLALSAHAPYSVSPALFREIARRHRQGPLAVHLAESKEELEFLRAGTGPIPGILRGLGVWIDDWSPPRLAPVDFLATVDYLRPGLLAVHGVHLTADELEQLRRAGATLVTCARSNLWVGAGMPRISSFYASGVPVAVGTDSLASVASLSMFDELAELRRIAPDVAAASLLESATRVGAEALGFGATHGTLAPGKSAAIIAVSVPPEVADVEEYLVSGVSPRDIRGLP